MSSRSILSYQGPLSFSTIDLLLSEFKLAAQDNELSFKTYKKMISIMIEALENITRYNDQLPCNQQQVSGLCPSCQINRNDSIIELVTSNPVKVEHVNSLKARIDRVNKQGQDELKELYRSTITNGEFTSKGGAGLGFIEMAKTTGNKLEYQFENLTTGYARYTLKAILDI